MEWSLYLPSWCNWKLCHPELDKNVLIKIKVKILESFEILECGGKTNQAFVSQLITAKRLLDLYFKMGLLWEMQAKGLKRRKMLNIFIESFKTSISNSRPEVFERMRHDIFMYELNLTWIEASELSFLKLELKLTIPWSLIVSGKVLQKSLKKIF